MSAQKAQPNKVRLLLKRLLVVAVLMFGFGYLLVPIYNTMCKQLGINGKTNGAAIVYDSEHAFIDKSRTITVEFLTNKGSALPWDFEPKVHRVKLHPGEMKRVSFFAKNKTGHTMTVQAIPSVTPGIAAKYLKKTECFCFTQQTLDGHEAVDMPLLFHLDPEIPAEVKTLTLSYTMFDVSNRYPDNKSTASRFTTIN